MEVTAVLTEEIKVLLVEIPVSLASVFVELSVVTVVTCFKFY